MLYRVLRARLFLIVIVVLSSIQHSYAKSVPASKSFFERDQLIRARAADYEANIRGLYAQDLAAWSRSFLERRRQAILASGQALAAKAADVRTAKNLDWNEVRGDSGFLRFERQQIFSLINENKLREDLKAWAKLVEEQTRTQMIVLFKQLVAEDLGSIFDKNLRGEVVRAVDAIPIELLLVKEANVRQIEDSINAGLPQVALSRSDRELITSAARILGAVGAAALTIQADPITKAVAAEVLPAISGLLVAHALSALDRWIAGEPNPQILSAQIEQALIQWRDEELGWRLKEILDRFAAKSIGTVEFLAQELNSKG